VGKVVLVSGAARGLGLVQAEALLEAGAIGELNFLFPHFHLKAHLPAFSFHCFSFKYLISEKSFSSIYLQKYKLLTPDPTKVYALDRLENPSNDFSRIQKRATNELGTSLHYRRIDVRDQQHLNAIVEEIATKHQRLDGLIAAAGIQQETPALEYTAKDSDLMLSINVTGCFMTAQAAAKQMIRFGNGGSVVLIASMSGTIANRVSAFSPLFLREKEFRK
jgi:NAD(P)-dependent dehydrogenase (short-subunit alcohol dehydrogenase family)